MRQNPDGKFSKPIMIDDSWSQPHAVTMVDLNGDGRMDFVTGKRFMAHNGKDPGEREPLGVYWFEYLKPDGKKVEWVKHVLDYGARTGGGMQIAVADLDGDGALDIATPGKSGLFLFENLSKKAIAQPWHRPSACSPANTSPEGSSSPKMRPSVRSSSSSPSSTRQAALGVRQRSPAGGAPPRRCRRQVARGVLGPARDGGHGVRGGVDARAALPPSAWPRRAAPPG